MKLSWTTRIGTLLVCVLTGCTVTGVPQEAPIDSASVTSLPTATTLETTPTVTPASPAEPSQRPSASTVPSRGGGPTPTPAKIVKAVPSPPSLQAPVPQTSKLQVKRVVAPKQGSSWQVQYTGTLNVAGATVINLDGADITAQTVADIHARGGYAICYFNAGAFEQWRSDAARYPQVLLGRPLHGWAGERWVDIRRLDLLMPILEARMDACASKGFDAIDPDNVDGWANQTGFALTQQHSIALVQAMARAAHARGLAMGLKNAVEIIPQVANDVDFGVNEECVQLGECGAYLQLLNQGKAVFHVEYTGTLSQVCAARNPRMSTLIKDTRLGPARVSC